MIMPFIALLALVALVKGWTRLIVAGLISYLSLFALVVVGVGVSRVLAKK